MVTFLCRIASVNRSSYYAWLASEDHRTHREQQDEEDYKLLKTLYKQGKKREGGRQLKIKLENDYGVIMNLKKIFRLTRKFHIQASFVKRILIENLKQPKNIKRVKTIIENLCRYPGAVLLTDITYLYLADGTKVYLSCVKDGTTREIVTHHLTTSLEMSTVYKTLQQLNDALQGNVYPGAILHSDQAFHYTHPRYQKRVKELGLTQSMSRRGNCLDNASMESFFGHFKDHVESRKCKTLSELKGKVEDFITYYNSHRYQWALKRMTPEQYRGHLLAA
ncbi:LOW QUALITY PROTEIN: mobile element protein [Bacillus sp. JCM 19047]|nr:LOW QUALITY PROTEIN: mobile element protein [Bacillus sp. JCM 19047]